MKLEFEVVGKETPTEEEKEQIMSILASTETLINTKFPHIRMRLSESFAQKQNNECLDPGEELIRSEEYI